MPIKFKYDLAAVPGISNQTTRRFGQSLVEQQRQQNFAGQQLRQQLGARDFQNATSNMSSYLKDMLDNNEITDEPTRRRLLALRSGVDTVMGSGFTDDQRRHYLNQYNSQIAGILANAPAKPPELTPQQKFDQGIVTRNGIDYVPGANGRYEPLKQPEQPKLPEPPPPQPKTMEDDYNFGARKGAFRKDFNSLKQQMQEEADLVEGSPKVKDEDVLQRMQQDWEFEQNALGKQSPSAGALPAPTTGASVDPGFFRGAPTTGADMDPGFYRGAPTTGADMDPGFYRGNAWASVLGGGQDGIARPSGPPPTLVGYDKGYAIFSNGARVDPRDDYAMKSGGTQTDSLNRLYNPDGTKKEYSSEGALELAAGGGMNIPDDNRRFPGQPQWREEMKGQVSPDVDRSGTFDFSNLRGAVAQNNYNAQLDAMRTPMTPEQIAVLDAQTNATMDSTNAQLAENQARADEVQSGYAPRTNSLKRQADAMSNKTDRAESALRGELLPRSPQGERPSSMYDISDAKDKREAEQFAKNKEEYGKYKARRDEGDAALQARENKPIDDPKTMKQDARQFSAEYQLYKRGGGTLSTRDYITQMAKQGKLSPDLKRQLEHNYKMDLSDEALAGVEEQDVLSQKGTAKEEAKVKRDAKANRRKYPMGMPSAQQTPAPAAPPAANVAPPAATPLQVPSSRIPPAFGTVDPVTGQQFQRGAKYPEVLPPAPATPEAVPGQQAAPTTAAPALPKAPKPDFESIANAADEDDRALIVKLQPIYDSQSPDVQNAINVVFGESSLDEDVARALAYLNSKGILDDQLTAPSVPPPVGRRGNPGTTPPKPANKGGMGPFPKPTGGRRGKQY